MNTEYKQAKIFVPFLSTKWTTSEIGIDLTDAATEWYMFSIQ